MAKTKVKTKDENTGADISESLADSVYINPLTYFGFNRLFYNTAVLISFLNDVVGTDIKDVVYRTTERVFKDKASKDHVIERAYVYRETIKERISDKLQMIFIELPKFKKAASKLQNKINK
jgi:hypothetical protein